MQQPGAIRTVTIVGVGLIGGPIALAPAPARVTRRVLRGSSPKNNDQRVGNGSTDSGVQVTTAAHDGIIAYVSHLAQIASTALAQTVLAAVPSPHSLMASGPGLVDMTRLAMSSYDVWQDILGTNRESITAAIDRYIIFLQQ